MCGGDPLSQAINQVEQKYSPRVWRWSLLSDSEAAWKTVFSTCVEVIPSSFKSGQLNFSILHVCGGDPKVLDDKQIEEAYSPRVWRWSHPKMDSWALNAVFSTCVEVILIFEP